MDLNMICKYIEVNQKEELPQIMEEASDYKSTSYGRGRSPSISSTNSSQASLQLDFMNGSNPYISLYMRFPK